MSVAAFWRGVSGQAAVLRYPPQARLCSESGNPLNGNIIEQLVLLDERIERMRELLERGATEAKVIAERERTVQLLACSRQLLLGALRLA